MVGPRQNCNKGFLYRIIFYKVPQAPEKNPPKSTLRNLLNTSTTSSQVDFSMLFWTPQGNTLPQKTFSCIFVSLSLRFGLQRLDYYIMYFVYKFLYIKHKNLEIQFIWWLQRWVMRYNFEFRNDIWIFIWPVNIFSNQPWNFGVVFHTVFKIAWYFFSKLGEMISPENGKWISSKCWIEARPKSKCKTGKCSRL